MYFKVSTVCLNMIVKNEEALMPQCLEALKPHIDSYVICDTGSTDNTKEIIQEKFNDIPGEVHDIPFNNFGYARNKALKLTRNKADYILFCDADMIFKELKPDWKDTLTHDSYMVQQQSSCLTYSNIRLLRDDVEAEYIGATHEFLDVPSRFPLDSIMYTDLAAGSNRAGKFARNIKLIEEALEEGVEDELLRTRYLFYLAESYYDNGQVKESIPKYRDREQAAGWIDERYCSLYKIGNAYKKLNMEAQMVKAYLDAFDLCPHRLEAIYELVKYYRENKKYSIGYLLGSQVVDLPEPKGLFVYHDIYRWKFYDELSICAYWVGEKRDTFDLCSKILALDNIPDRKRIEQNRNWCLPRHQSLEITTKIGCPIVCKACPQELLESQYTDSKRIMTLADFSKALSKVPLNVSIHFSGMSEPWLVKDCTKMLLHAHNKGYNIVVYTTLVGMSKEDVKAIESIPFSIFEIHLPDQAGNAKIKVTKKYLEVLKAVKESSISNITTMTMGTLHDKVAPIFGITRNRGMHSRAGNIKSIAHRTNKGPLYCVGESYPRRSVLLPNGDVVLCCMDYSKKHVLGNLYNQNYEDLFFGDEYSKVIEGMKSGSKEILCKNCNYALA